MEPVLGLSVVLGVGVPLVFLIVIGLIVWGFTHRPRSVSPHQAVVSAGYGPSTASGVPVGQWNAQVAAQGEFTMPGAGMGHIRLENGWLGFHEGGVQAPTWIVPVWSVRAGKNTMFARNEVWLEAAQLGRVNLSVSHEHINQWMGNDFKNARESRYADEFLWFLQRAGAQVGLG